MRALLLSVAASVLVLGCLAPITPMERLQQSANEVAGALRFNRTDVAAEYCAPAARESFFDRHAVWTDKTRVVDLELIGIYQRTADEAEAIVHVEWLRSDGAILHTTEIAQKWKHEGGSFRLVNEVYRAGDKSLFEMLPKKEDAKKEGAAKAGEVATQTPTQTPTKDESAGTPAGGVPAAPHAQSETRAIRNE